MSRYIDADVLSKYFDALEKHAEMEGLYNHAHLYNRCLRLVEGIPTADVVEVRHGEWIEQDDGWDGVLYTCSVCRCDWTTIDGTPFENNMRYCPECGAKMDGERRANDGT